MQKPLMMLAFGNGVVLLAATLAALNSLFLFVLLEQLCFLNFLVTVGAVERGQAKQSAASLRFRSVLGAVLFMQH